MFPLVKIRLPFNTLMLLGVLLAWPELSATQEQPPARAIILSWDGAVPSFIHDLLRQGKLPNLSRLIGGGVFADSVITAFPSKTAAGHASLWTGAPPRVNGISGNTVPRTPRSQFTILETASGFHSTSLRAEPLWMAATRAGRRAVIVQATQAWPFELYIADGPFGPGQPKELVLFEGYAGISGRDGIVTPRNAITRPTTEWKNLPRSQSAPREIEFMIGPARFYGLLIDDPSDPVRGYDTLIVTQAKDAEKFQARLRPGPSTPVTIDKWSPTIELEAGKPGAGTRLRLFELKADASDFLLYYTRPARKLSSRPELLPALRKAAGAFVGNGATTLYRQGAFGTTIPNGGNGSAESRYLETALVTQRQLMEASLWAIRNLPWDLLITYTPYPDEAEHLWRGYLEPMLPGFRRDLAGRIRPFLEEVYRMCDEFLGLIMKQRPANTVIALVADHGVEGVNRTVSINAALEQAGLLALNDKRRVDLTRTKALYPAANNAYILINTTDRKAGIVEPQERAQVVTGIRQALRQIRHGKEEIVTAIFDAETQGEALGIGGEAGGDIYLDLLPGYDFDARLGIRELITEREPYGTHLFNPTRSSMRTILVLNGPGVAIGRKLSVAHSIDFAPTAARLLGIPVPRHATGQVLTEALSR